MAKRNWSLPTIPEYPALNPVEQYSSRLEPEPPRKPGPPAKPTPRQD